VAVAATAVVPYELVPEHERERDHETARQVEQETPAPIFSPEVPLSPVGAATLQRSAGNAAVCRLISGGGGEEEDGPYGRWMTEAGARARIRPTLVPSPRKAMATAHVQPPLIQRAPPKAPAAPAADEKTSDIVLKHLMQPLELSLETKGPKPTGYVKLNKASLKGSVKISPSEVTDGDVSVGGVPSARGGDKTGTAIAIAAEAKQKTQTDLTKHYDKAISEFVKSVTGKDNALKTELFAKAKAEAKRATAGGKSEYSAKVGFDFGIDAAVFGVAKVTTQVKLTLVGIKAKPGGKGFEFEATAFAAEPSQKVAVKWKKAFSIHEIPFDVEGSVEWGAEFEPNWAKIAADAAADVGTEAAVIAAIDFALLAGPPLLAGFVLATGIVAAGEKGQLHRNIAEAALDASGAAMVFAQCMTGSELPGTGPRAKQAHDAAMAQIKTIATSSGMEPDELMTELRNKQGDFPRIYSQSKQQIYSAFDGEVGSMIAAWRKEHYILAIWTRAEDDMSAAKEVYEPIFNK
jgi:hypothetical protein